MPTDSDNVPSRRTGSYRDQYQLRAARLLGSDNLWSYYEDFLDVISWTDGSSGTVSSSAALADATDAANAIGGVRRLKSGTDVAGVGRLYKVASDFPPTLIYNNAAAKFFRACRFRMITTPDANTQCWAGSFNWRIGVIGGASITKYAVQIAGAANYILSTVTIDTAWHILRTWYDGTNGYIQVDNEGPVALAASGLWPMAATQSFPDIRATKAGGAVDHQIDIDHVFYTGTLL